MWGQDAGVDVIRVMREHIELGRMGGRRAYEIVDSIADSVVPAVARGLGLVEATPAVATTVQDAVSTAHILAGGVHRVSPQLVRNVEEFVRLVDDTPGFLDDVANLFVRLDHPRNPNLTGEVAQLVSDDGVQVLRALYRAAKEAGDEPLRIPILLEQECMQM